MKDLILEKLSENKENLIKLRTYLHENPELSGKELNTSKFLKNECKKLGLLVEGVDGSTGFTALLDTGRPGRTLGLRTDIDALPVEESRTNLKGEKSTVSKNEGVSHACGHDSHMTIALGAAKILTELKDKISGKIYFIYEEGEEIASGIDKMVDHLRDKNIDAFYGNHTDPKLDVGKFSVKEGPAWAGCVGVDFDVIGKGGHGSRPDKLTNPIIGAAHIITALNSAWNNQLDFESPVTLGIGSINAGASSNAIPDLANIKGTLRFFDKDAGKKALELLKTVAELTARAHGCKVVFNDYTRIVAEPVINDRLLTRLAKKSLTSLWEDAIKKAELAYVSETFSAYSKLAPAVMTRFGIRNEGKGMGADLHTSCFDLDNRALYYGTGLMVKFALDFLGEKNDRT